ncbi:hypothetical protein Tph_c17550 [Thermacetogenium phaeum DSM 12270]|uniref:Uncharacterized protein n=1 Tax=Thermacetogenium phaeum (strain ATCC BAA-254 / DSM 26808 / PB) TaxID=1089553 RepID=K4LGH1_THEPS|nr:hypothetical protein [Thermacetogenium phaeum]AFV11958.1 hypothetical protein Tph_c17550 [Thermacetogenium phaeum DSM 12270]
MFRKRLVYVLLLLVVLLSGCALWQSDKATVTGPLIKVISADLPLEWRRATGRLVDSAWVCGSGEAGYAEPPVVPIGQVTKEKLYASAWTAALLHQANETVSPDVLALLDPWLDQLVQQEFTVSDGYPKLHNLYLYYLLRTSLGKTVDKAVCLRELLKLRHTNGLYSWDEGTAPELDATQVAANLLVFLNAPEEALSPTRRALQTLLNSEWTAAPDSKTALMKQGGPLILAAYRLHVPFDRSQARAFVAEWTTKTLEQIGNDPFSIEVLLQLAELHQAVGSRLTLPLMLIQEITSKRGIDGGFSIQPDQGLEPQYTFKVQKLLLLVAGIPPEPTAARKAAQRFRGDSWYTTGPSRPDILDTYYGLAVSRLLNIKVPKESLVAKFLQVRLEQLTASPPDPKSVRKSAAEIYYILASRELLDQPFMVSGRVSSWIKEALYCAVDEGSVADFRDLGHLTGAAALLQIKIKKSLQTKITSLMLRPEHLNGDELNNAFWIAQITRALGLPPDKLRQAPSVATTLSVKDEGGGFRHASSAPFPDLYSTYKTLEVFRTFAPNRAKGVLPRVKDYVRSCLDPKGGIVAAPGLSPTLRSTFEGLTLLSLEL